MLLATALVLELARQSLTGSHCRDRQYVNGLPTDEYVTRPCSPKDLENLTAQPTNLLATPPASSLRIVDGHVARRVIVESSPLQPYAHDYDVATGELLRRVPLFFRGNPARVFDPNPVVTLNDPSLRDGNDLAAAVPASAYFDVELENTFPFGALSGLYVTMVDRQPPAIAPPGNEDSLQFDRQSDGFEDVNAYFHLDRTQRYLQSLGYRGQRTIVTYAIPVDAHASSGADNSFFIPSAVEAGRGALFFGEGGTDDAEDADLLVHEYTHAIHEWIAPGTFGGSFASESRALAEGMADYWAYSAHAAARRASGRDPFCFADWDARCADDDASERCAYAPGADCLRRLDSTTTMAGYDRGEAQGVEHHNGSIWSSALREIHDRIGKRETDTVLIESLFDAPPRPTFEVMALRLLEADRLVYQGLYDGAICSAMYTRGILTQCDLSPHGEATFFPSQERGLPIPDNNATGASSTIVIDDPRAIEAIQVRVDIDHPSRGDLHVELIAPDGTVILLHEISSVRAAGIHVTYGLTAEPIESLDVLRGRSAAGVWSLTVNDLRPFDAGTLRSWGLILQFAGEQPSDARPHGAPSQMIPVVAHLYGAGETLFRSDVQVANTSSTSTREATLVFTRSGENGNTRFAAMRLSLLPSQSIVFEDVLESLFQTAGSGTLEVLGEVAVSSRTYVRRGGGTFGQLVPPNLETTTAGAPPLLVAPLVTSSPARYNLGISETAGARGTVRAGEREVPIEPFSHVQFPVGSDLTEIRVVEGGARITAYLSQIESGEDAMFIPAERAGPSRTRIAPAITSPNANDPSFWRSALWAASRTPGEMSVRAVPGGTEETPNSTVFEDVLAQLFHREVPVAALQVTQPENTFAATRIAFGDTTQFVPLLEEQGGPTQELLFVESSPAYRSNLGIVSTGPAVADVRIHDAAGQVVETFVLWTEGGVAQSSVTAPVVQGRATVHFVEGTGRAYGSLIDSYSGDATYVWGR